MISKQQLMGDLFKMIVLANNKRNDQNVNAFALKVCFCFFFVEKKMKPKYSKWARTNRVFNHVLLIGNLFCLDVFFLVSNYLPPINRSGKRINRPMRKPFFLPLEGDDDCNAHESRNSTVDMPK